MKLKYIHISWFSEYMMISNGLAGWSDSFFYSGIHAFGNLVHLRKVTSKSNAPVFRERLALHLSSKQDKCQELIDNEAFWKCCREEANSNSMLELFIWHAFRCFCYYNHTERFASENPVHLWMARRKKITHTLPEACHSRRCLQD